MGRTPESRAFSRRAGGWLSDKFTGDARHWLLGIIVLTVCSWARYVATGSPKVDENYPREAVAYALFAGVVLGWTLLVVGWRGLLVRPVANPRRLAFTGLAVTTVMLPLLSNDLFSLLAYGSLAARGQDVYTTAAALPESVWYRWIGEHWNDRVCVYGPTTLVAILPARLAGSSPWVAMALLRLLWLPPLVLVMEQSFRRLRDRPFFHTMLWLNPLWIFEGPGQLHADVLGVTALVAGILVQRAGRPAGGWACWALATLGKYSFAFAAPWYWLSGAETTRQRLRRIPAMGAALVLLGVAFFWPFWRGMATLTQPVAALAAMNPGGSIVEVVGHVVHVLRGGAMPSPEMPIRLALEVDRATKAPTWFAVSLVLRVVALGAGLRVLQAMLRAPSDGRRPGPRRERDEQTLALGTGALVVLAVTLASHRFQAWYLLAALPFFGLSCTRVWQRWWVAIVAIAILPDFTHVLPTTTMLLPVWSAVTTAAGVILFLVSFRARYLTLGESTAREPASAAHGEVDAPVVVQAAPRS